MAKTLIHTFKIKPITKKRVSKIYTRISKICLGVCVNVDGVLKCKIELPKGELDNTEFLVLDFTPNSFSLKGKRVIFLDKKDKTNHWVKIHRDKLQQLLSPEHSPHKVSVVENEVCSGYIVRKEGIMYFDMKDTHGRGNYIDDFVPSINTEDKLFLSNGNKTSETE